jgi:hypothetical protein
MLLDCGKGSGIATAAVSTTTGAASVFASEGGAESAAEMSRAHASGAKSFRLITVGLVGFCGEL